MDLEALGEDVETISERYAAANGFRRDPHWFLLKLHEEMGELTQALLRAEGQARTRGESAEELRTAYGAEVADVLCHVLLLARHTGVDLPRAIEAKWLRWLPGSQGSSVDQ